jgi:hypothetical protein
MHFFSPANASSSKITHSLPPKLPQKSFNTLTICTGKMRIVLQSISRALNLYNVHSIFSFLCSLFCCFRDATRPYVYRVPKYFIARYFIYCTRTRIILEVLKRYIRHLFTVCLFPSVLMGSVARPVLPIIIFPRFHSSIFHIPICNTNATAVQFVQSYVHVLKFLSHINVWYLCGTFGTSTKKSVWEILV